MKTVLKAAKLIAYDNGAVNRNSPEMNTLTRMVIYACQYHTLEQLVQTEAFLSSLSETDLYELCTGEEGKVEAPEYVSEVLNTMFDHC